MRRGLLIPSLMLAAACRATSPAPSPSPPAPPGASDEVFQASEALRWVRDSAEHAALFHQIYRHATAYVEEEAAKRAPGTWVVVVDADETVLDNSLYQLEGERQGRGFTLESWHAWTERQEAVPLPGARAFLDRVQALGGRIAVVTNRRVSECPDTEAVLRKHELLYDVILCRPDDGPSDKSARFASLAEGTTASGLPPLEIIAFLGDSIRDFPGESQSLRQEGEGAFNDFGARFFVLPNPLYGSWE